MLIGGAKSALAEQVRFQASELKDTQHLPCHPTQCQIQYKLTFLACQRGGRCYTWLVVLEIEMKCPPKGFISNI
jgi:hypothetical protein